MTANPLYKEFAEMQRVTVTIDASEAERQMDEFSELLQSRFLDGIPDQLIRMATELRDDIILTDSSSTLRTDGTIEIVQRFRFGSRLENLRAAILAGEFDVTHDVSDRSRE